MPTVAQLIVKEFGLKKIYKCAIVGCGNIRRKMQALCDNHLYGGVK